VFTALCEFSLEVKFRLLLVFKTLIRTTADEEGFILCWLACGCMQWSGKYRDGEIHLEI